jgi:hypothetical protein
MKFVSFGEVLWWECVTWHIMRRGGPFFYSTLDMWSWAVCFLKMSFRRRWCDICILHTAFLSIIEFLRWFILSFISNFTILSFEDLCYSSPGMWVHRCTTCREDALLFFPFKANPWRMCEVEYICYIWRLPVFTALHKYSHYNTGYVMCFPVVHKSFLCEHTCCNSQNGQCINAVT